MFISTHTPTRGVTAMFPSNFNILIISTHTPTRGVTGTDGRVGMYVEISTHTPTRGVTDFFIFRLYLLDDFYSHAHEGRDGNAVHRGF